MPPGGGRVRWGQKRTAPYRKPLFPPGRREVFLLSENKTEYCGLRLWAAGDRAGRSVLNGNAAVVDTALKALEDKKCEGVLGSYTGTGAANRTISLGFTPRAVILVPEDRRLHDVPVGEKEHPRAIGPGVQTIKTFE